MTKAEYLTAFLERVAKEGPYHILSFDLEDEETGEYWLTLQLPEPYEKIQSKNYLFSLMFEEVNFKDKTITFVVFYKDIVEIIDKTWLKPKKDANVKPVN